MKIKCEFCSVMYDDTLEECPHCGGKNENVRRGGIDAPITVEELKKWYEEQGLPPYEVTRFFIGIDYKEPKAFGIYKDENSGNFVVYKNKDTGARAIRYEGSDEAFAVNELWLRLKQEIISQKKRNEEENAEAKVVTGKKIRFGGGGFFSDVLLILGGFGIYILFMALTVLPCIYFMIPNNPLNRAICPMQGYYDYNGDMYYHMAGYKKTEWIKYSEDSQSWETAYIAKGDRLFSKKDASTYFVSGEWDSSLACSDATKSTLYTDFINDYEIGKGYYSYEDDNYYHIEKSQYDGWFHYDSQSDSWDPVTYESVPADLQHGNSAGDFWYTPTWDSSTQITDFTKSSSYKEYQESHKSSSGSSSKSSSSSSWSSGSSWDSGSTDWGSDW